MPSRATAELALADLSAGQLGVFTRTQAVACGVPSSTLADRVADGRYVRLREGVYLLAGHVPDRSHELLAARLWVGGEAALSHHSAAEVFGLPYPDDFRVHVLVRDRSWRGVRDVAIHRTSWWFDEHVMLVGPHRVTTPARTIVDLAGRLGRFQLTALVNDAVRQQLTTADDVRRTLRLIGRVRGAVQLREVLDELSPLHAATASRLESMFVDLATRWGCAPTAVNYPTRDAHGRQRFIDAVYLPERVAVELDGDRWHGTPLDRAEDRRRQNALVATGEWRHVLRYGFQDLRDHSERVRTELLAALGR